MIYEKADEEHDWKGQYLSSKELVRLLVIKTVLYTCATTDDRIIVKGLMHPPTT